MGVASQGIIAEVLRKGPIGAGSGSGTGSGRCEASCFACGRHLTTRASGSYHDRLRHLSDLLETSAASCDTLETLMASHKTASRVRHASRDSHETRDLRPGSEPSAKMLALPLPLSTPHTPRSARHPHNTQPTWLF